MSPSSTHTVLANTDPSLGYTRVNYTFTGWNTQSDGSGTSFAPGDTITMKDDVMLYAQWKINTFTVTFKSNGGTSVSSQTVDSGGLISKPTDPKRSGYTFQGWFTDDGTFLDAWIFSNDSVTADLTLYAKWTAQSDANGNGNGDGNGDGNGNGSGNGDTTGNKSEGGTTLAQAGVDDLLPLAFTTFVIAGILSAGMLLLRRKSEEGRSIRGRVTYSF